MGLALARHHARARALLALASDTTGIDVPRALERGARALSRTEVIQPVLVAVGLGFAHALADRQDAPDIVLGHSLGELTAACFALDLPDETAITIARARGLAMSQAATTHPGGMLAVRTTDDAALGPLLAEGLTLAAINAPDERVLSGPLDAITRAERVSSLETRRLSVAGPWHHRASMTEAAHSFRASLADLPLHSLRVPRLRVPVLSTITLTPLEAADIPDVLVRGLLEPVRWSAALDHLVARGLSRLTVAPPARVLTGLVRRGPARSTLT